MYVLPLKITEFPLNAKLPLVCVSELETVNPLLTNVTVSPVPFLITRLGIVKEV